jgi:peptidoglycan/xylan/chitin deacetylase (PgdA/CDA1 family)
VISPLSEPDSLSTPAPAPRAASPARRTTHTARQLAKRAIATAGLGLNRVFGTRATGRFGILMYHRVADHVPGVESPTWNVTPAVFREQMAGLLARNFRPWPLRRLIQAHAEGQSPPPGTFAVTFDDGHDSVYRQAWPVLAELGIPATLFLPTAYIDDAGAFPFDDWPAAGGANVPGEAWRPMTSEQCREIAADGLVELGAHTHTHQDFCGRHEEFAADLHTNVEILRERFGIAAPSFAFPFGRATAPMMASVRREGASCALTTSGVLVDAKNSPFGWGRFNVESWDTAATLAAKLSGWCSWPRTFRRPLATWRRPGLVSE